MTKRVAQLHANWPHQAGVFLSVLTSKVLSTPKLRTLKFLDLKYCNVRVWCWSD